MTDDTFWQRIIESGLTVPADRPLTDLTAELVELLGSPIHIGATASRSGSSPPG